ncbi:DNA replication protein DnaC [Massilia sp. UYP11]|uniref:AAA family ATPase n=1 Tax=Massilia sp. UYP11 TaxID=1756385 RepID=UPI003D256CEF
MNNNKNRFAEDWEDGWTGTHKDIEELLGISDKDDYEPTIEETKSEDDEYLSEIRSLYQDDHGLSYAVVYAQLFLIEQEEAIAPASDNWRFSFNALISSDTIIKFYKTRRDSPEFVRARIRAVLDSIGWNETEFKQSEEVLYKYLSLELACRRFIASLHSKKLLARFVEECKANYDNLSKLTKDLDRDTIAKGITADIFTGVVEEKYVESPLGAANRTQTIQWVASEIQDCAKGKDNSRFLDRLYSNRFKERLEVDEEIYAHLEDRFPHFSEVISYYKAQFRLNLLTGRDYIPPVLLLGAPGIGKTIFAKELAHALQTGYTFIDMASASASWTLSGLSSSWNGAKAGKLATTMLDSPTASPVVVLDEVEKSGSSAHGQDSRTPLYQLLEENTAKAFTDEFVDFPVDLSRIIYIACANSTEGLTEPLLTRFKIMEIRDPSDLEHDMIVDSIYQTQLAGSKAFPSTLPGEIKTLLRGMSLREAKVMISDAIATALLELTLKEVKDRRILSITLHPHHFKKKAVQKKKIGF